MALPRLIEFIESIRRDDGGMAAEHGWGQVIISDFPRATSVVYTVSPPADFWAYIIYKGSVGLEVVPGAFTAAIQQVGHQYYGGTVTQHVITHGIEPLMIVTTANPLEAAIRNVSGLVQYWEHSFEFAGIRTRENYELVLRSLDELAAKNLRNDIISLLNRMRQILPPVPVMGGRP